MYDGVDMPDVDHAGTGAARRRRERRHRAYLRYARMSVAMALAEENHHTAPRGLKTARAEKEVEEQVKYNAPRRQKAPPGMRPASLAEPQGTQVVFERHVEEQVHDAPVVPILAALVPHMVDQLDVLKILGMQLFVLPEQVIEVPTISTPSRCSRTVLSAPQMAEQLVEVPTVLSYALLQQWTLEQIIDIPVPRLGGGRSLPGFLPEQDLTSSVAAPGQRSAEQNIDIPIPRRGARKGLQGFPPGPLVSVLRSRTLTLQLIAHGHVVDFKVFQSDRVHTAYCGAER